VMGVAGAALSYPFGPIICWMIVGAVDTLSPVLNPTLWPRYLDGFNVDIFIQQCSSALFGLFIILLIKAIAQARFRMSVFAEMFAYYFIVVTTFPISQHRYLIASWPFLILALLDYRTNYLVRPTTPESTQTPSSPVLSQPFPHLI
jgi:hypothetical protein